MKIVLFLFFLLVVFSSPAIAQEAQSNIERIKFGHPAGGVSPQPSTDTTSVIGASLNIKAAYDSCANGYTQQTSQLGSCLHDYLSALGYSEDILSAFETRRASGIADGCTQCVGYVGLVLTLLSGSTSTLTGVASAKDVLNYSTITAGDVVFDKMESDVPIQPGDIGVAGGGTWGHILIVNTVEGNVKFTALESNGNFDCRITDSRSILKELYTFYRKRG